MRRANKSEAARSDSLQPLSTATASVYHVPVTSVIVAIGLMVWAPAFVMMLSYSILRLDGSPTALFSKISRDGFLGTLYEAWVPYMLGSAKAWKLILPYAAFELVLMRVLPGKRTEGPITPSGNVPVYKANGLLAYFITIVAYVVCGHVLELFRPADIYDNYMELIGAMNLFSLLFCVALYLKGRFKPSSSDCGISDNLLFDYYWGTELYPRLFDWDVKMFTNCRFGMMGWALLIMGYASKQYEAYGLTDSMVVAVALQLIYITKFFHWEMGYMKSLDIMHDRAGFYLCWGCLVFLPCLYTSHTLYLVSHPTSLGTPLAALIFIVGAISIFVNYDADRQREMVRRTNGDCKIWGRRPSLIHATYNTTEGEEKKSLLLSSGWWGISRHFHYIPELMAALSWSIPALFQSVTSYFYFLFLLILLTHRAIRDDRRCAEKYGKFWKAYCDQVPYKIIPFLY